jgi:RNA polymerase sigma-70 factor (ECF subfamily)
MDDSEQASSTGVPAPSLAELLDQLATRAGRGDRGAFEEIYNHLAEPIFAFVRARCESAAAEDVMATVFLNAWRSARRYKPGSLHYEPWIFAIARNELKGHWRARRRVTEPLEMDVAAEANETAARGHELRYLVAQLLSELTREQREVVFLRYYGDRSHAEIAEMVGKREGAVRALHLRALRQLRKEITRVAI